VTAAATVAKIKHVRVPGLWLITWVSYSVAAVAAAGVAVFLNANTISEFLNGMAFNALVHVFCGAIYIYHRHQRGGQPQIVYQPQISPVAGSVNVHTIQSASLTCGEKIYVYIIGWCIKKVEFVIWLLSNVGIDLSAFFFPSPFYSFEQAKLITRHYRFFRVHGVQLHADAADAYFLWLSEKMLNLITLTLYKRIMGDTYPRWLDSKLRWNGPPPAGFNNHFRIFHNSGTLCERLCYYLQVILAAAMRAAARAAVVNICFQDSSVVDICFQDSRGPPFRLGPVPVDVAPDHFEPPLPFSSLSLLSAGNTSWPLLLDARLQRYLAALALWADGLPPRRWGRASRIRG